MASLHRDALFDHPTMTTEAVDLVTLDAYCSEVGIDQVDFVKTDTEGHDMAVLLGAERKLTAQKVGIWQFEYTWRWIAARRSAGPSSWRCRPSAARPF